MKGWKTWAGTIGWVVCEGAKSVVPEYDSVLTLAQNVLFLPLGVVGLGHKLDRAGLELPK
jgi:hypothetical protein